MSETIGYFGSRYFSQDGALAVLWLPDGFLPPRTIETSRPDVGAVELVYHSNLKDLYPESQ